MITVLAVHFAVAAVAPFLFRKLGRNAFYALAAVPAGSVRLAPAPARRRVSRPAGRGHGPPNRPMDPGPENWNSPSAWTPWPGSCRCWSSAWAPWCWSTAHGTSRTRTATWAGSARQLLAFAGAMFGLVTADDLLLLFMFWELTTVLSYLLIGHDADRRRPGARRCRPCGHHRRRPGHARRADACSARRRHVPDLRDPRADPALPGPRRTVAAAVVLILVGAVTKSALVPFHFWLPGRHGGADAGERVPARRRDGEGRRLPRGPPRPGVRGHRLLAAVVLGLGLATMLVGGYRALRQTDIKLILAYGTVASWVPHHGGGARQARRRARRPGHAAGPRALQGDPVPRGGHHRPPVRHPGHPQALRRLPLLPGARHRGRHRRRVHGRRSAAGAASWQRNPCSRRSCTSPARPATARGVRGSGGRGRWARC